METKSIAKYIRVSPQKARLVIDQIRGKNLDDALVILNLSNKAVSKVVSGVVKSAAANAENNNSLNVDNLYVKKAFVDAGPTAKRMRPRAMGRANQIKKRTSHITVVLDDKSEGR